MAKGKPQGKEESGTKVVALNKKARRDYEILNTYEAGLVLLGSEIKSIRNGGINLKDSYVREQQGELFLVSCHISPYSHALVDAHEPLRDRKLLMHRQEIVRLGVQLQQKGLSIVPLRVYLKKGRCKVELGLGRGKKLYDKREDVKAKTAERQIQRALGRQR